MIASCRCPTIRAVLLGLAALACGGGPTLPEVRESPPLDRDAGARVLQDAGVVQPRPMTDAGPPLPPDGGLDGQPLYPVGPRHSPLPAPIVDGLREVMARGPGLDDRALMKVGDSISVSPAFLACFDGEGFSLDGRPLGSIVARFAGSWSRVSTSATVGWSASAPLDGMPSPLHAEHSATAARFATVMLGTNDVGFRNVESFARDLWEIVDTLISLGTIPLLSTIAARDDSAEVNSRVPLFNLSIRALAQGRGVPLVDFHAELSALPDHGLSSDGVHPTSHGGGCVLDVEGLRHGYNVRNLITLEQLSRVTGAIVDGPRTDDPTPVLLTGTGTPADPYAVPELPFASMGDTRGGDRGVDVYDCSPADESGPARVYRVVAPRAGRLTVVALSARGVDVDVHLLDGSASSAACVVRDNRRATATVSAGTHFVSVDTFVSGGEELSGAYLILAWLD